MDSSSNDSFVWTTDSHESSDSDGIDNKSNTEVENTTQNEMKVDFTDQKLKKSSKNLIDIDDNISTQKENHKMDGRNDTNERKKRKIKHSISENNMSTDESHLNMKVKHEEDSVNDETPKKSKKKKKQKTIEENDTDLKMKRKSSLDMSDYENNLNIKAKYEEDTVTEETPKKSKKKKKHKTNSISNDADDYKPENINNQFFKAEQTFDQNIESESHANYLDMKVKQEKNNFTEPLSVKSKKKKSKTKVNDGPNPDFQSDCSTFGEGYLDMKVKQEENGFAESTPLKRKKKKSHTETNGEIKKSKQNDTDISYDSDSEYKSQKKNKKSPTENRSMSEAKCDSLNSLNVTNTSLLKTPSYVLDKALIQKQPETETQKHKTKKITKDSSHISSSSDDDHDKNNETAEPVSTITHRSPPAKRIPDRLTFENDETDDEQIQTNESSLLPTRVQHILKGNTNLTPVLEKPSNIPAITQDDDIWILKLPSEIDVQALTDKEFILDRQCKIKLNSGAYYGTVEDESNRIAVMSCEQNKFVIRNLSSSGIIKFRKRIPRIHLQDDNLMNQTPSNFIPLPETKCRHPLFGPNFKKAMKIPKHVTQRLKSSQLETSHPNEPKKKKKHKKAKEEPMETFPEEPILEPDVVKKKAKKRKHTDDIEGSHKKTKRIKYNPESTDAWDTEKAVEENLFNF